MLKDRIVTAFVLLIVFFISLVASSPVYFGVLTLLFVAIAAWEWGRLSGYQEGISCGLAVAVIALCSILWCTGWIEKIPAVAWFVIGGLWVISALWLLNGGAARWSALPRIVRMTLGFVILSAAWCALWFSKAQGNNYLLSVLFLVWMADTGAYFSGKKMGKHKLAPSISPGKSWEGVWGGVATVIVLAGVWIVFDLYRGVTYGDASIFLKLVAQGNMFLMILVVVFLTFVGILGDLSESLMKRSIGIKDSGSALPGHGGALDRIDALLPVLPLTAGFVSALS